jgi:hypothetical protein
MIRYIKGPKINLKMLVYPWSYSQREMCFRSKQLWQKGREINVWKQGIYRKELIIP